MASSAFSAQKTFQIDDIYPVGAVYIAVTSTSPATLFGGTWSAIGAGRTLVGIDSGDTDFDTAEETGGHKDMQSHTHIQNQHRHSITNVNQGASTRNFTILGTDSHIRINTGYTNYTTPTNQTTGDGDSENLMPYLVVYMWKRTA